MKQSLPAVQPLYRQILNMHAVPRYGLVAICLVSALFLFASWYMGWALWQVGLLVLLAWLPLILSLTNSIYRQYGWVALLFLLVVSQGAHTIEHAAQMVQIHLLGLKGLQARGIFGALNIEWVHLIWNVWVLLWCGALLLPRSSCRKNMWLLMLFVFALYHAAEHIYIVSVYLQTNIQGTPGFLAQGGLFGGGLPILRPDLHFLYAVLEEAMLIMAYVVEIRKHQFSSVVQQVTRAAYRQS